MIYVRSELYRQNRGAAEKAILFGEKEGRIALANRRKDPLLLFSALRGTWATRAFPACASRTRKRYLLPALQRRVDRLENRLRLVEEEPRGGINLARYYARDAEKKEGS